MLAQLIIAACGIASVWLSQSPIYRTRRWACIIGILAQPAWLWVTFHAEQWGMFALSIVYTIGWGRGIWNFWIQRTPEGTQA